jgi:hypothetical protein
MRMDKKIQELILKSYDGKDITTEQLKEENEYKINNKPKYKNNGQQRRIKLRTIKASKTNITITFFK